MVWLIALSLFIILDLGRTWFCCLWAVCLCWVCLAAVVYGCLSVLVWIVTIDVTWFWLIVLYTFFWLFACFDFWFYECVCLVVGCDGLFLFACFGVLRAGLFVVDYVVCYLVLFGFEVIVLVIVYFIYGLVVLFVAVSWLVWLLFYCLRIYYLLVLVF